MLTSKIKSFGKTPSKATTHAPFAEKANLENITTDSVVVMVDESRKIYILKKHKLLMKCFQIELYEQTNKSILFNSG